jgi:hypothetical protein
MLLHFAETTSNLATLTINVTMKKSLFALSLLGTFCIASLTSCEKVKDSLFPPFETQISDVNVTIPITVQGEEASSSNTVSFDLDSTIKDYTENAFNIDNLNSVKVKDITVYLTDADAQNDVSNFESVQLKIASNTVNTPAVVANTTIPNTPANNLNIPAGENSPELKEYLKGNELSYTITSSTRRSTTKPLNAVVSVTLSLK